MDRCALFVDAGYMLADGAMAVHGTRRGDSVTWDYEGLLQLLSSLARERSGLPVLRCYWYEATVDGRRTAEHDALADVPGIKLRMAKIRPGRREGVETEIHRDLTTLARNDAISDALVISAEEDLAQIIADVQDLGIRVTLVHIAVDGNWTISRALRQESDDIIEISGEHLRPYVELIAGAEPAHDDEREDLERSVADHAPARSLANGHSTGAGSFQQVAGSGNHAPPAIYTAPVVAEYQRPAPQLPRTPARELREVREAREAREAREVREAREAREVREAREAREAREPRESREPVQDRSRDERAAVSADAPPQVAQVSVAPAGSGGQGSSGSSVIRPDPYSSAVTSTRVARERQEPGPARSRGSEEASGYPAGPQEPASPAAVSEAAAPAGQLRRLPARSQASQGSIGASSSASSGQHGGQNQAAGGAAGSTRGAPYSGPQPVMTPPAPGGYQPAGGVSLADAVQAAHEEGQEFGGSVARDAPALWLEAVLARKPRMPSDLEARLLQGSALPIDFLLHDEVRHALRRGFWDALERTRR